MLLAIRILALDKRYCNIFIDTQYVIEILVFLPDIPSCDLFKGRLPLSHEISELLNPKTSETLHRKKTARL